jgi:t-SNARE complex subunit (syntaxin)
MPDDPIGREIAQFRKDVKDDFTELRSDLAGLVSREVHDAHLGRVNDRVTNVEKSVERLVGALEADKTANTERRAADRRMVVGAMLAAALSIVVDVVSATGGPV